MIRTMIFWLLGSPYFGKLPLIQEGSNPFLLALQDIRSGST